MLKPLKFVQGSVAKKDFMPALTHFVIENGKVRGFNGVMALCSPIPFDIKCQPKATMLIKAIANCDETVQLALTPAGRLSVKAGKFKAFVDCVDDSAPHPLPEGLFVPVDGQVLLDGLKVVERFMGNDASRKWAQGVLVKDASLFATNNIVLVQYWTGTTLPHPITIPAQAVKEMLRIDEGPEAMQVSENSITFHYSGDRWLRTQLWDSDSWPDLGRILDKPSTQVPIDEQLFDALEVIKPFADSMNSVLFQEQGVATHPDDNEGAQYEVPSIAGFDGKYSISYLELLKGVAKSIDWTGFPGPCIFMNDRLRGAIIGIRK